jgi:hypothetical protein
VRAALLILCVAFAGCFPPLPDYPYFVDVSAGCVEDTGLWTLWAEVRHQDDSEEIVAVWVAIGRVFYDDDDDRTVEAIGVVDLPRLEDGGEEWLEEVESGELIHCDYPYEYSFVFIAEDADGDRADHELVN